MVKNKCDAKWRDKSVSKKKKSFIYCEQKTWKTNCSGAAHKMKCYLHSIDMTLHTFLNAFRCLVFHNKVFVFCQSYLMFHYVLFNLPVSLFIFSLMAQLPCSQLVMWWKCLQQKCLWQRCLWTWCLRYWTWTFPVIVRCDSSIVLMLILPTHNTHTRAHTHRVLLFSHFTLMNRNKTLVHFS